MDKRKNINPITVERNRRVAGSMSNGFGQCYIQQLSFAAAIAVMMLISNDLGADQLTLEIGGVTHELVGDILIDAQDGSLYFQDNAGTIWFVMPDQIKKRVDEQEDVEPMGQKELAERLLEELPEGFRIYKTRHYIIAYQTEVAYARWIGGLYEGKLYRAFDGFWQKKKKFDLNKKSKYPLVAIIFGTKAEYQQYVDRELGPGQDMVAYYNIKNNRVAMFDLTAGNVVPGQPVGDRQIEQVLQNPAVVNMVATVIHEGTHQLMFNRGMQTRFADCPLWVNEGLAMYFEAPDLNSQRGWERPGLIFRQRYLRFLEYAQTRPADSLQTLLMDDERFRGEATALDAYAEAWAFNYFLLNKRSKEYVAYLQHLSTKKALEQDTKEQRLADFKKFLGEDMEALNVEFLNYIGSL